MPAFHVDPIARAVSLSYLGVQASRTGDAGRNIWWKYPGFHEGVWRYQYTEVLNTPTKDGAVEVMMATLAFCGDIWRELMLNW